MEQQRNLTFEDQLIFNSERFKETILSNASTNFDKTDPDDAVEQFIEDQEHTFIKDQEIKEIFENVFENPSFSQEFKNIKAFAPFIGDYQNEYYYDFLDDKGNGTEYTAVLTIVSDFKEYVKSINLSLTNLEENLEINYKDIRNHITKFSEQTFKEVEEYALDEKLEPEL